MQFARESCVRPHSKRWCSDYVLIRLIIDKCFVFNWAMIVFRFDFRWDQSDVRLIIVAAHFDANLFPYMRESII